MMSDTSEDTEFSDIPTISAASPPLRSSMRRRSRAEKVDDFTGDLEEARTTLKDIDDMLGEYGGRSSRRQGSAIDRLRDDLVQSNSELKKSLLNHRGGQSDSTEMDDGPGRNASRPGTYRPTSPLYSYSRNSGNDQYRGYPTGRRPRSSSGGCVTFDRTGNPDDVHELHQTVRNLTEEQRRINAELYKERKDRHRSEREQLLAVSDFTSNLQKTQQKEVEKRLEKKLQSMATEYLGPKPSQQRMPFPGPFSAGSGTSFPGAGASMQHHNLSGGAMMNAGSVGAPSGFVAASEGETFLLRSRLTEVESENKKVTDRLGSLKEKCQDLATAKGSLMQQLSVSDRQVRRSEEEREAMSAALEREREIRERMRSEGEKALSERDRERERLVEEGKSLREQLSRSVSGTAADGYKEELARNERQRVQLSDHIQSLTLSVQSKEELMTKFQVEVQELTNAKFRMETQQEQVYGQLEEAAHKIRDITRQAERYSKEAADNEQLFREADRKKEEVKVKAQETIKQWKSKCKMQEKEAEAMVQRFASSEGRIKEITQETELLRHQLSNSARQIDQMSQELGNALAVRSEQDEKMRVLSDSLQDSQCRCSSLEKECQEKQTVLDKRELSVQSLGDKVDTLSSSVLEKESQVMLLDGKLQASESAVHALKEDMMTCKHELTRMTEKYTEESKRRVDLGRELTACRQEEKGLRQEMELLEQKLLRLEVSHQKAVGDLKSQLDATCRHLTEAERREVRQLEEFTRKFKSTQKEKDGTIAELSGRLCETEEALSRVQKIIEVQGQEMGYLEEARQSQQDTAEKLEKKWGKARRRWEEEAQQLQTESERAHVLDGELADTRRLLNQLESQNLSVLQNLLGEIEEVLCYTSKQPIRQSPQIDVISRDTDVELTQAIYRKLHAIKAVLDERQSEKDSLQHQMALLVETERGEKERLLTDIRRQQSGLDEMAARIKELQISETAKAREIDQLECRAADLNARIEEQIDREALLEGEKEHLRDRVEVMEEMENSKDTVTEKKRIEDRYKKLQMTMSSLREELSDSVKRGDTNIAEEEEESADYRDDDEPFPPAPKIESPSRNSDTLRQLRYSRGNARTLSPSPRPSLPTFHRPLSPHRRSPSPHRENYFGREARNASPGRRKAASPGRRVTIVEPETKYSESSRFHRLSPTSEYLREAASDRLSARDSTPYAPSARRQARTRTSSYGCS